MKKKAKRKRDRLIKPMFSRPREEGTKDTILSYRQRRKKSTIHTANGHVITILQKQTHRRQ